ncbi:MAG: methyl-accepting chemotaxis protein [Candidatus Lernaella stagnicola]|nr:methyl-accepting chemotaxis protein [Candidatus Lernaella stagnicola]
MAFAGTDKRKRYFIDKTFQGKFVALLVVFIVSLGIAGVLILWLGGDSAGNTAEADIDGAMIAMLLVVMLFVGLTVWYGVRFSHRIVGPVYAFNRHLNWVRDGNYTRDLHLREKDEFQNLAQVFNATQALLRQRAREEVEIFTQVDAGLTELLELMAADDFDKNRAQELVKNLRQKAEGAKVKDEGLITP